MLKVRCQKTLKDELKEENKEQKLIEIVKPSYEGFFMPYFYIYIKRIK
jgi:hypothetical protein